MLFVPDVSMQPLEMSGKKALPDLPDWVDKREAMKFISIYYGTWLY